MITVENWGSELHRVVASDGQTVIGYVEPISPTEWTAWFNRDGKHHDFASFKEAVTWASEQPETPIMVQVNVADIPPRLFDRRKALEQFQQACSRGVWCEVWEIYSENNKVKIAEFPGLS